MLDESLKHWDEMTREEQRAFAETSKDNYKSASKAAEAVGATRSAILGYRLRIRRANGETVEPRVARPKPEKKAKKRRTDFNAFVRKPQNEAPVDDTPAPDLPLARGPANDAEAKAWGRLNALPAWDALPDTQPKELWQLGACECHWPVWRDCAPKYLVCAAVTVPGEIYCTEHRRMAGGPTKARAMPGDNDERTLQRARA